MRNWDFHFDDRSSCTSMALAARKKPPHSGKYGQIRRREAFHRSNFRTSWTTVVSRIVVLSVPSKSVSLRQLPCFGNYLMSTKFWSTKWGFSWWSLDKLSTKPSFGWILRFWRIQPCPCPCVHSKEWEFGTRFAKTLIFPEKLPNSPVEEI